jgi:serine/threonine-protein kinase ULK/ATG1
MEYCELGDLSMYIKQKGIVHIIDTPDENDTHFISKPMENQFCNEWGGLNEEIVRHFLRQLGSSMEFLRSNSLIHRDLKPQVFPYLFIE